MKKLSKFSKGDKVRKIKSLKWSNKINAPIEQELSTNYTYIVEEVGLGLNLVKLQGFIPLVRTKYIKHENSKY